MAKLDLEGWAGIGQGLGKGAPEFQTGYRHPKGQSGVLWPSLLGVQLSLFPSPALWPAPATNTPQSQRPPETPPSALSASSLRPALWGPGTQAHLVGMHGSPQVLHPLITLGC